MIDRLYTLNGEAERAFADIDKLARHIKMYRGDLAEAEKKAMLSIADIAEAITSALSEAETLKKILEGKEEKADEKPEQGSTDRKPDERSRAEVHG